MVAIEVIRKANQGVAKLPSGLVAVFLGATSGIGQSTLEQFASLAVKPHIYIVARRAAATESLLATLRERNSEATYTVIEKDVSLIRETDDVVAFVKQHETRVDFLFASVGFIAFDGRHDTDEGLEPSMTTRYYSRLRAVQDCSRYWKTPQLLGSSPSWLEEKKENFLSTPFPGLVNTPILGRGSSGLTGLFLRNVVKPVVNTFFAISSADAGARALFYATNDRYAVETAGVSPLVPLPEGVERSPETPGGIFLSDEKSESVDNETVLADLRQRKVDDKVWEHTMTIFTECEEKAKAKEKTVQ